MISVRAAVILFAAEENAFHDATLTRRASEGERFTALRREESRVSVRPRWRVGLVSFSNKAEFGEWEMPVKVRCQSCDKVFAAPDAARGKAVKWPGCQER